MLLPAKAFAYSDIAVTRRMHKKLYGFYDWINTLIMAMAIAAILFTFVITTATVKGDSMLPTLHNEDRLLVSPLPFDINRGDIVLVAQDKAENPESLIPLIKRVIGVGGDKIDIDFEAGIVYVNDQPLDEPYVMEPIHRIAAEPMEFPLIVKEGHIFVLGDNRNDSRDSRSKTVGQIDTRFVYGKVLIRYYPINKFGPLENPFSKKEENA